MKKWDCDLKKIKKAESNLKAVISPTPLLLNLNISEEHQANVYLKREDLQIVRSYKIRGAFNKISSLGKEQLSKGIVCASAGNHAQGVAYSCRKLKACCRIFMPQTTPMQKISQVKMFGQDFVEIILTGDSYDDSYNEALGFAWKNNLAFIHPFDDEKIIEGQATVALEILRDFRKPVDFLFVPVGGGGLASGIGGVFRRLSPKTKIIGVEPSGAPSMKLSLQKNKIVTLDTIDKFVDGAAVKRVGEIPFETCKNVLDDMILVPEGKVCSTILKLYNKDAIVIEPAGALSISALDFFSEEIKGKNVVCIVSGSNNDITRMEEIKERSLLYEGLKHYFIIRFPQRAGALREFLNQVLGKDDDITYFEYSKKNNREQGPAVVGIELKKKEDFKPLYRRMKSRNFFGEYLNNRPDLFQYLI